MKRLRRKNITSSVRARQTAEESLHSFERLRNIAFRSRLDLQGLQSGIGGAESPEKKNDGKGRETHSRKGQRKTQGRKGDRGIGDGGTTKSPADFSNRSDSNIID